MISGDLACWHFSKNPAWNNRFGICYVSLNHLWCKSQEWPSAVSCSTGKRRFHLVKGFAHGSDRVRSCFPRRSRLGSAGETKIQGQDYGPHRGKLHRCCKPKDPRHFVGMIHSSCYALNSKLGQQIRVGSCVGLPQKSTDSGWTPRLRLIYPLSSSRYLICCWWYSA